MFAVAEASKNETGGGEGVEVIKNEPFTNQPLLDGKFDKGQYTYKIYHLNSKVPAFVRMIAPKGALAIHEEAWNAYPYCRTIITVIYLFYNENTIQYYIRFCLQNPDYMKNNFKLVIETMHAPDRGTQDNIHLLTPAMLKNREIIKIDIANDHVIPSVCTFIYFWQKFLMFFSKIGL